MAKTPVRILLVDDDEDDYFLRATSWPTYPIATSNSTGWRTLTPRWR